MAKESICIDNLVGGIEFTDPRPGFDQEGTEGTMDDQGCEVSEKTPIEAVTAVGGIGSVIHRDERTNRRIVITGFDPAGLPLTSFETMDTGSILNPYTDN